MLAVSPGGKYLYLYEVHDPGGLAEITVIGPDEGSSPFGDIDINRIAFSPDSEWLVMRRTFANFFAWKVHSPDDDKLAPAIDLERSGSDGSPDIRFIPGRSFALGTAQDGALYGWELETPLGNLLFRWPNRHIAVDKVS